VTWRHCTSCLTAHHCIRPRTPRLPLPRASQGHQLDRWDFHAHRIAGCLLSAIFPYATSPCVGETFVSALRARCLRRWRGDVQCPYHRVHFTLLTSCLASRTTWRGLDARRQHACRRTWRTYAKRQNVHGCRKPPYLPDSWFWWLVSIYSERRGSWMDLTPLPVQHIHPFTFSSSRGARVPNDIAAAPSPVNMPAPLRHACLLLGRALFSRRLLASITGIFHLQFRRGTLTMLAFANKLLPVLFACWRA